ncbi:hypothetical protein [Acidovorax sp. Leaf160]|uniref:hypothetical protein n=1 Tax=Acidovorax sp. Leaf160 TaxID=1736280 RepID=UPI000A630616|nr:hypothetical protein [Acidovorax sp. Leaf160]
MAVQPAAQLSPIPEFPALSDRAAGTYNGKAYAFGAHMGGPGPFVPEINALAENVEANALAAKSAKDGTDGAVAAATVQADAAMGYRNQASSAATTAGQQAGIATDAASTATTKRNEAVAAAQQAVPARDQAVSARDTAVAAAAQAGSTLVATSSTEFANSLGVKTLVLTAGKAFIPNVTFLRGASRATPNAKNGGYVTEYSASTGAAKIAVSEVSGPTTNFSDWDFALGSPGGMPGISIVTPDTITNCNDLPNNSITRINAVTSTYAAKNLPCLIANSASSGWSFNIPWIVETVGFDTLYKTQTATPALSSNNSGVGLSFLRTCENGTWGAWRPRGGLPSSIITTDGNHMYDTGGASGLNRRNIISGSLNGAPCNKYMPTPPVDGDVCIVITNARADNRLYPIGGVSIRTGEVIVNEGESLGLDMPYTAYQFTFHKDHNNWFAG